MFATVIRWWHDGEDSCVFRVYHSKLTFWGVPVILGVIAVLLIAKPSLRHPVYWIGSALPLSRMLCERRRAIVLTESSLVYRPLLRAADRVPWDQVEEAERINNVLQLFLMRPRLVPGFKFTLKDGTVICVPLDVATSSEVPEVVDYVKARLANRARF